MAALLTTVDAQSLLTTGPRRQARRRAAWLIFAAGIAVTALLIAGTPTRPCTEAHPCGPDLLSAAGVALLLTTVALGWVWPLLAAATALAALVTHLWWYGLHPAEAYPLGGAMLVGYAVLVATCAAWVSRRPGDPVRRNWSARTGGAPVPAAASGYRAGRPGRAVRTVGLLLIGAAVLLGWYAETHQRDLDARQRTATVVGVTVTAHPDEFTLAVTYPDGRAGWVDVLAAADYPIGTTLRLAVDDRGLAQPLSEPYDAGGWTALAIGSALLGAGFWWRGRVRGRARAGLLTATQPVSTVFVNWRGDLFAGDARPGSGALARVTTRDRFPTELGRAAWEAAPEPADPALGGSASSGSTLDGSAPGGSAVDRSALGGFAAVAGDPSAAADTAGRDDEAGADRPVSGPPPVALLLYGVPAIGEECVLVDAAGQTVTVVALRPADSPLTFTALAGTPVAMTVHHSELTLVPPDELTAAPATVHRHHKPRLIGYALAASIPLATAEVIRRLPVPWAWTATVAVTLVGLAAGWALWLRPGIAWNGGGVAVNGVLGGFTARWPEIAHIAAADDLVHVTTVSGTVATVTAQARRGGRTAASLRAGLEHARGRYAPGVAPPPRPAARLPWALLPLAAVPIALLMALNIFGRST